MKEIYLKYLEDNGFPHVAKSISATWGTIECRGYFKGIIVNLDRDRRNGFPADVFDSIMKLYKLHENIGQLEVVKNDSIY